MKRSVQNKKRQQQTARRNCFLAAVHSKHHLVSCFAAGRFMGRPFEAAAGRFIRASGISTWPGSSASSCGTAWRFFTAWALRDTWLHCGICSLARAWFLVFFFCFGMGCTGIAPSGAKSFHVAPAQTAAGRKSRPCTRKEISGNCPLGSAFSFRCSQAKM